MRRPCLQFLVEQLPLSQRWPPPQSVPCRSPILMSLPECGVGTAGCLAETSRRLWSWDLCAQDAQPWFPSWPPLTGQVGSPGLRANLQLNGVKPERAVPPLETAFPFGSFPRGGRGAFLAEKGPAFCCFPTFLPLPPPTPPGSGSWQRSGASERG